MLSYSVIISNWNGLTLLKANLSRVIKASGPAQIIVVDDASPDASNVYLAQNFPQVQLLHHPVNRGFAAGCNTGVAAALGDIVILLNLDVIPQPGYLKPLDSAFADPNLFAVSFNEINNRDYSYSLGQFKQGFIVHQTQAKDTKPHLSFWASGGSGAFRKTYWSEIGGFDDQLLKPFYWEDIDLAYRAQKRGWHILWLPEAKVSHEHQGIIGTNFTKTYINQIWERNQLLVIWKNLTDRYLLARHVFGLISRLINHPGYLRVVFLALARLPLVIVRRRVERHQAKISDRQILHL